MAKVKNKTGDKQKTKSLFDHINEIRTGKNREYFKTLSDADKKTWSNYMVCRFLSMQMSIVDSVNELQYYQDKLEPEQFYRLCIMIVPSGRGYYPYIKKSTEKYNKALLELLCLHFKESERNVLEYVSLLSRSDIMTILKQYGYDTDRIEELLEIS
jgi:hypothetical protein